MIRPTAAAVVAVTIVVALTVNYWFFLVGGIFYAGLVFFSLQDADESRRALDEVLYPQRKLDMNKLTGGYRTALQQALDTKKQIESAVAATGEPGIRKALLDSTGDLDELTGTIYELAIKAQSVQGALQASKLNSQSLNYDIQRLQTAVNSSADTYAKGQYEAALDGKRRQLQDYNDTVEALDRWHAQLDNAQSTLGTILSQVLHIRSSEVLSLSSATDALSVSLKQEVDALKATSDALDTVYGRPH